MAVKSSQNRIPDNELQSDMIRIAEELGRPPTPTEYDEMGNHSTTTLRNRVSEKTPGQYLGENPWEQVLAYFGFDPEKVDLSARLSDEEVLNDVAEVAKSIGHPPSVDEYRETGEHSVKTVLARGDGKWDDALQNAGLNPDDRPSNRKGIHDEELIFDVQIGAVAMGKTPTTSDLRWYGEYSNGVYSRRYGSYAELLEKANLPPSGEELSQERAAEILDTMEVPDPSTP